MLAARRGCLNQFEAAIYLLPNYCGLPFPSTSGAAYKEAVISLHGSSIRFFLERDKRPIQRRVSKIPPKNALGKLTVGTASTLR